MWENNHWRNRMIQSGHKFSRIAGAEQLSLYAPKCDLIIVLFLKLKKYEFLQDLGSEGTFFVK